MYRLIDEYGNTVDELVNPTWLKQQRLVDRPISANSYEEADGVVLSDGETMVGIKGRNMQNYPPLVTVEEVSGDPYIMQQLTAMQAQVTAMQKQSTTTGEQVAEMYAVQAGDVVVKSELDAAYREGVNAYAE